MPSTLARQILTAPSSQRDVILKRASEGYTWPAPREAHYIAGGSGDERGGCLIGTAVARYVQWARTLDTRFHSYRVSTAP